MPSNPFSKNLKEPQRPKLHGHTAKENPVSGEDKLGGMNGVRSRGGRPGTVTPGSTTATPVALSNVMHPTIELDSHAFSGHEREIATERDINGEAKAKAIPWHAPDDAAVMARLFGINIED